MKALLLALLLVPVAGAAKDSTACASMRQRQMDYFAKESAALQKSGWKETEESRKWRHKAVEADCDIIRLCPLRSNFANKQEEYAHHDAVWRHSCAGTAQEKVPVS